LAGHFLSLQASVPSGLAQRRKSAQATPPATIGPATDAAMEPASAIVLDESSLVALASILYAMAFGGQVRRLYVLMPLPERLLLTQGRVLRLDCHKKGHDKLRAQASRPNHAAKMAGD
jgi:hypothetical protein